MWGRSRGSLSEEGHLEGQGAEALEERARWREPERMLEKVSSARLAPFPGLLLAPALRAQFCLNAHIFAFPRSGGTSEVSGLPPTDSFSFLGPPRASSSSRRHLRNPSLQQSRPGSCDSLGLLTIWAGIRVPPPPPSRERGRRWVLVRGREAWPSRVWWNRFPERKEVF